MINKQQLAKTVQNLHSLENYKLLLDNLGVSATFVFKKLIIEATNFYDEKKDGWFYLAIKHIVDATGYCDKTIRKGIKILEQKGYIQVERNNGNKSYYKILKLTPVTSYRGTPVRCTGVSDPVSFNINNTYLTSNKRFSPQSGSNEKIKIQNSNKKQPNKEQLPNLGHTGAFAPNGGKSMRRTNAGYTRSDLRANSGKAATGKNLIAREKNKIKDTPCPRKVEDLPAPAQGLGLTAKYPREIIRLAKWWYVEVSPRWLTVRRKGWEGCAHDWCKGVMKVITGPDALCTFERLKTLLQWALTDAYYSKNIRDLSRLKRKWDKGSYFMLDKLSDDYDEANKQTPKKQEQPFDIHNEIPQLVYDVLSEKYDTHEEYFDDMCEDFEKYLAEIWDWLDKQNSKQPSNNKQSWIYSPKCAEKFAEIVRLWNEYGKGKKPDFFNDYACWKRFWKQVQVWQETELQKNEFGIWTITNLANYIRKQ